MRTRVGIHWGAVTALMLALAAVPIVLTWREPSFAPLAAVPPEFADRVLPGELVVDLRDDATPAEIAALETRYGLRLRENSPPARDARLMEATLAPGQDLAALAARLSGESIVEAAAPAREAFAFWRPNDPRYREQWNMRLIGMERAWEVSRGKGVVVAVIDTGVACEQDEKCTQARDFKGIRVKRGYDFVHNDAHPTDDAGHGTHVAGTIAESTNNREGVAGVAFEATIMPLKVLTAQGSGTNGDVAAAIRYAADHGAKIINMSLGMPFPDPIVRAACRYASRKGVTIVCAAGNGGSEGVYYPAAFPECIAVSAVGPDDTLTPYSSYGPQIALAAPGGFKGLGESGGVLQNTVMTDGTSLKDDYFYFQGTSMASPHVAGVAALVMARGVTDPAQVRALLKQSARRKGSPEKYGAGRLDAAAAVAGAAGLSGETALKLGLSLPAILPLGVLALRRRQGGSAAWPLGLAMALLAGWLGPDALVARLGFASPWHLLGHSALLPALCLTEAASRRGLRLTALFAGAMTLHLLWDLLRGTAPQATGLAVSGGWQMALWLATNAVIGVGITLAAIRKAPTD